MRADVTICVDPTQEQKCPVTDVRLVKKKNFTRADYPGFTLAEAPSDLPWHLLYSTDSGHLPLARFELTEEQPCSLDSTIQVTSSVKNENIKGRTRDRYRGNCRNQPLDGELETTYRSASKKVTVNEADWLEWIGAFRLIDNLPKTKSSKSYKKYKSKNELQLW